MITALSTNPLPTSFRLFVRGWNDTENGRYLFDDVAAKSVMAAYKAWGIDISIDLEHQMLQGAPSSDPTARDARGWCKLALHPDGSLWATEVRWTQDGAARLRDRRQRYVSPAFDIDPKTNRVVKIVNIALTALPATHQTPALVAARKGANVTQTSNVAPPPVPPAPPSPEEQKKIAAIAQIFNTDPDDLVATAEAVGAFFAPFVTSEVAARKQLTASELAAVKSAKGCTAVRYLAAKMARGGGYQPRKAVR